MTDSDREALHALKREFQAGRHSAELAHYTAVLRDAQTVEATRARFVRDTCMTSPDGDAA